MDLYTFAGEWRCAVLSGKDGTVGFLRLLMQTASSIQSANVWVSTPSFAEVCLSEKSFSEELLPKLQVFLFCGETLGNRTVQKLPERFPKAAVVNTYGPTEYDRGSHGCAR